MQFSREFKKIKEAQHLLQRLTLPRAWRNGMCSWDCSPVFVGKEVEGERKYLDFHQGEKGRKRKGEREKKKKKR